MLPPEMLATLGGVEQSMRFTRVITPMLKQAGVDEAQIEVMLTDNPRRYFSGEPLPLRAPLKASASA